MNAFEITNPARAQQRTTLRPLAVATLAYLGLLGAADADDVNGLAAGAAAAADESAVAAAALLDEVIVSARRREESVQDVPIPIAVLSGRSLEEAGRFRFEDLSQRLPSTNVQFNNPRQTSIALRGLGNNPANDALESSVGVYLDNVYLGRASMANLDLIDVDQIALLRGPQGTLFGKNTTAGVVNIQTRKPTFERDASIETSYGDLGYYQVRGTWSQALIEDKLAARVSYSRSERGGFVRNVTTGRDLNGWSRYGVRAQLLYQANEDLSFRLIHDRNEEHSDTGASVLYSLGPDNGAKYLAAVAAAGATVVYDPHYRTTTIDARQHMDVNQGGTSLEANWNLGGYTLTSVSAYRHWSFLPWNDGDGTNLPAITLAGQEVDDHQWSQELRIASPADRPLSYVAGVYYFNQKQDNRLFTQFGPDLQALLALQLGGPAFVNGFTQSFQKLETNSGSVFGQATWRPADRWELALGFRTTREKKTVSVERVSTGLPGFLANPNFANASTGTLDRHDTGYSGLFSVSYKLSPSVLAYTSISRGAKSGGINPAVPNAGFDARSLYVEPEIATDGELGIKSTLADGRVVLNANAFWVHVRDYQATLLEQPNNGGTFVQVLSNVGKVRSRGFETDIVAQPIEGLSLRVSASYNDAKYLSYANAPCSAEQLAPNLVPGQKICDLSGAQLVGAPKWIVNPGATYTHDLFGAVTGTVGADYAFRSSFYGSADNSELAKVKSFGLLNLRYTLAGRWGERPWALTLWSNNALNKHYVIGGLSVAGRLYQYTETPGAPRTYGATIRVDL